MRKLILLFTATLTMASFAVVKGQVPYAPEKQENFQEVPYEDIQQNNQSSNTFGKKDDHGDGWFNYVRALVGANQTISNLFLSTIHPDTLTTISGEGERNIVNNHSVGKSMDPKSELYESINLGPFNENTEFVWDSVRIPYSYTRRFDSFTYVETDEIQDTLYDFTVNGSYQDTLAYVTDTTYHKKLTHKFFVNGMVMESVEYMTDTTWYIDTSVTPNDTTGHLQSWMITYTDGTPNQEVWPAYNLDSTGGQIDTLNLTPNNTEQNEDIVYDSTAMGELFVEVYLDDTSGMPQVDSSMTVWPNYNVHEDTAQAQYDTNYLMADGGLKNAMTPYSYNDTISSETREVVDTVYVQLFALGNGLSTGIIPGDNDTTRFSTVGINRDNHRGDGPVSEVAIELTADDVPEEGEMPLTEFTDALGVDLAHKVLTVDAGGIELGAGQAIGITVTFEPGHPYETTDTILDFSGEETLVGANAFRLPVTLHDASIFDETLNNNFNYGTLEFTNGWIRQKFHPESIENSFLRENYYPFVNQPSSTNPARHFYFDFHVSAQNLSTEDVDGNADKVQSVYPNPANINDKVAVKVETDRQEEVSMKLYNAIGKEVKNIPAQTLNKGSHDVEFSTSGLKPGVYFLNVNVGGQQQTVKLSVTQ